jgi:Family of unknown function (DUF5670)
VEVGLGRGDASRALEVRFGSRADTGSSPESRHSLRSVRPLAAGHPANLAALWRAGEGHSSKANRPKGIKTAPLRVGAKTKADTPRIGLTMFLAIAAVLVVLWALGFIVFHVAGALIHLLIVLAVISVIVHFVMGRRSARA